MNPLAMRIALLAFLLLIAPIAAAQGISTANGAAHMEVIYVPTLGAPTHSSYKSSFGVVLIGGAVGYSLGAGVGYSVGLATDSGFAPEDILSGNGLIGAGVGGSIGASLGAHLANGRRGTLWLGMIASAAAQGLYTYAITREPLDGRRFALVVGIPLIGTATSVVVERLTSR